MNIATMRPGPEAYGLIEAGAVAVVGDRIVWVGPAADLPPETVADATDTIDGGGAWLTPGLIDCHTHAVFGGNRAQEFELRLSGVSYEEIARRGGGILSTVSATRAADDASLLRSAERRIRAMTAEGVTTVEIKSGYGLDVETELRMLRVARTLGDRLPVTVSTTLLGAHALPPEFAADRAGYVELVCDEMIPRAAQAGLADAVDAFCEGIAFTVAECEAVFESARAHGLPVRLHADQLSDGGGAALAARTGARSADHLEYASREGVEAMAGAHTTAVLLPGAFYFLGEERRPPVSLFREHGVPMAVATDLNPGSSPLMSPLSAMNMACVLFGLTPEEALAGMTRVAASVLGLGADLGQVDVGRQADLVIWDVEHPSELAYWVGGHRCETVVQRGRVITPA